MGTIKPLLLENSSMYACVFKDIENNKEKTSSENKQLTSIIKIRMNEINIKSNKSKQNRILKDRLLKTKKENSKSAAIELLLQLSFF